MLLPPVVQTMLKQGQRGTSAEGCLAPAWPEQQGIHLADTLVAKGFGHLHRETSTEQGVLRIQTSNVSTTC